MYRCEKCKIIVPPNQKLNRVVTETREKSYAIFRKAGGRPRFDGPPEPVRNSTGFEIAKEMRVCAACAAEMAKTAVTPTASATLADVVAVAEA